MQVSILIAPTVSEYVPSSQAVQSLRFVAPSMAEYVPGNKTRLSLPYTGTIDFMTLEQGVPSQTIFTATSTSMYAVACKLTSRA
jgi:hypothetical protein